MKNTVSKLTTLLVLCAGAAMLSAGCESKPKMKKFDIGLTPQGTQKVEVDLVAVAETDADTWRDKNLDDYFSGNDKLRSDNAEFTRSFTFTEGQNAKVMISVNDAIWTKWHEKRPKLFVLANSRSLRAEAQKTGVGKQDPRRKEITLMSDYWTQSNFDITVTDGGIRVNPPPTLITK